MEETGKISDGYHTFDELYEHRILLWIALCRAWRNTTHDTTMYYVWRSRKHSDGSGIDGWFVLGIHHESIGQLTYHLPEKYWDDCEFAITCEFSPEFDGHTSADVLERLKLL